MKTLKDKRGYVNISKYPICGNKEYRKYWRRFIKCLRHKLLMHIPITKEEIADSWWYSSYIFDIPYRWTGDSSRERWVDEVYNSINLNKSE